MPEADGQSVYRPFECAILEWRQPAAAVADGVVMMVSPGDHGLVARAAVARLDPLHQALLEQPVERAVDAGDADSRARGANSVGDLLGADAAVLAGKLPDHGSPGPAGAAALTLEGRQRQGRPELPLAISHGREAYRY